MNNFGYVCILLRHSRNRFLYINGVFFSHFYTIFSIKNDLISLKYFFFCLQMSFSCGRTPVHSVFILFIEEAHCLPLPLPVLFSGFLWVAGNSLRFTKCMWEREETVGRGLNIGVSELSQEWALFGNSLRSLVNLTPTCRCSTLNSQEALYLNYEIWYARSAEMIWTSRGEAWATRRHFTLVIGPEIIQQHGTRKQASWPMIMQDLT